MAASFFFYDLETSGFSPRTARIMQFAGQRTNMDLKPIGEPINVLLKLSQDILPSPEAVLITGITPQMTIADGLTEAEFLKSFYEQVVQPDTVFVGFNNVRFDDEFMRFLHYRNYYDPYEWHWTNSCSRWDLLDVVRMTRALRPDGIKWPFAPDGKPTNRLEFLTKLNKLSHRKAHDALDDVQATIDVARLIKSKQPDLFDYLFKVRDKKVAGKLVESSQPFVYATGRYPSETLHTSVAIMLTKHPQAGAALVYDLRHDPSVFLKMSVPELVEAWRYSKDGEVLRLPVKTLKYNRCPAVAPLGVLKAEVAQKQIDLSIETVSRNLDILKTGHAEFTRKILAAVELLDDERQQTQTALIDNRLTVDERLYESFFNDGDKRTMRRLRSAAPEKFSQIGQQFSDERLRNLLTLYKARNFQSSLAPEELHEWEQFRNSKLQAGGSESQLNRFFTRLQELAETQLSKEQQYLLEELKLYGESIVPVDADG